METKKIGPEEFLALPEVQEFLRQQTKYLLNCLKNSTPIVNGDCLLLEEDHLLWKIEGESIGAYAKILTEHKSGYVELDRIVFPLIWERQPMNDEDNYLSNYSYFLICSHLNKDDGCKYTVLQAGEDLVSQFGEDFFKVKNFVLILDPENKTETRIEITNHIAG